MPKPASPRQIVERTRRDALQVAERSSKKAVLGMLERAQADLEKRLRRIGGGESSFTVARMQLALQQIKAVTLGLTTTMKGHLGKAGKEQARQAAEDTVKLMQAAEQRYRGIGASLPINAAALINNATNKAGGTILRRIAGDPEHPGRPGVLQRYGVATVGKFEERLQVGLATGKRWEEVSDDLIEDSVFLKGAPKGWADRIVRTETMHAYGQGAYESVKEADKDLGDCVKILVASFDDRTSWDSYQVHGQIRRPEEPFEWSQGSYMYPPNRPNDRETVVTWRISWPLEAEFEPRGDDEVEARYREQNPKGPGPGARPNMSTVDHSLFGVQEPPEARGQAEQEGEE